MFDSAVPGFGTCVEKAKLDPRALLIALGQASYEWCLETDRLAWSAGAAKVLGVYDESAIASGKAFAGLIDLDTPGGRHEAMIQGFSGGPVEGVPYCLRYAYRPHGTGKKRWIEDRGRWFAGPDGRPANARGLVRVVAECADEETGALRGPTGGILDHGFAASLAKACESGRQAGLFLVSIDGLGRIHAEFGPVVADAVSAQVMRGLRAVLRIGDSLASVADGKFALVFSGCGAEDLPQAAERLHRAVGRVRIEAGQGEIGPTVSIGGVHIAPASVDAGTALHAAQCALDRCERETPGSFAAFAEDDARIAAAGAAQRLAAALNEERIFLAFEPVLRARQAGPALFRARAFIRGASGVAPWQLAHLTPDCDRALARRFALRLIDLAGAALSRHPGAEVMLPLPVVVEPPRRSGNAYDRLTIELDEALAKADLHNNGRYCRAILSSGARLAVAGFGGGHLSFADLKGLGVSHVTLNGALVETAGQVAQGRYALRRLIEAAISQDIGIGAEWVDDETIARQLAGWGCDGLLGTVAGPLRLDLPRLRGAGRQTPMALTGT
ncbi:GGDEF-domain containing protein [Labrys miyagiensis]|uniref:GGDEF-domain containing protein n=1 Tax=Labrys miyagiensis TaxID=346912 RepID=A0ABQ6CB28_9HYPH|nr:EAL domain-containing protein [Labrys miyagiensis]GLS17360.1 GGDEF-domain containing protein [Labrys miyagiensis]